MCYIEDYGRLNPSHAEYVNILCGRTLPYGSTTYELVSLDHTLIIIDSWIHSFEENYSRRKMIHREIMSDLFKNNISTIQKPKPEDYRK